MSNIIFTHKENMELPLDYEPCMDYQAKAMADDMVRTGECLNWDHAYESSWDWLEYQLGWERKNGRDT